MNRKNKKLLKLIGIHVLAVAVVIIMIFPVYWLVVSALQSPQTVTKIPPSVVPSTYSLYFVKKVFTEFGIARFLWNSIFITIVSTGLTLVVACLAAFSYKAYEYRMKETFSKMVLFVYMFPQILIIIPIYLMMSKMGLINTYPAIILPQIAFSLSYSIQLFYSFNKFFPEEMLEAAIIDGCSPMGCFFKMVVPMSLNSIITVATMQAVFCWNEYINAYTFTRSTDMKTITLGLNDFVGSMGLTDWGATFAAITVTVLPVFIFYFFSSKKMLAGMTAGAVKG